MVLLLIAIQPSLQTLALTSEFLLIDQLRRVQLNLGTAPQQKQQTMLLLMALQPSLKPLVLES